jgi:fructose-specific phosphotransferase system component IIB
MAAEGIEKAAKAKNCFVKIETRGSIFRHETLIEVAAVRTTLRKFS